MCGTQCITKSNVSRNINSLGPKFVRLTICWGVLCMVGQKEICPDLAHDLIEGGQVGRNVEGNVRGLH